MASRDAELDRFLSELTAAFVVRDVDGLEPPPAAILPMLIEAIHWTEERDGMDHNEMARRLGIRPSTIRAIVARRKVASQEVDDMGRSLLRYLSRKDIRPAGRRTSEKKPSRDIDGESYDTTFDNPSIETSERVWGYGDRLPQTFDEGVEENLSARDVPTASQSPPSIQNAYTYGGPEYMPGPSSGFPEGREDHPSSETIFVQGDTNVIRPLRWVKVPKTSALQEYIEQLEILLPKVIHYATFVNLGPDEIGLTDEERLHLIDILEANLKILRAPLMEVGLVQAARNGLEKAQHKMVEKGVEYATLGAVMAIFEELGRALLNVH